MSKNIFCLIKTCALIQKAPNTALNFLSFLLANLQISQHSMLVKHGFNQHMIALISVKKIINF